MTEHTPQRHHAGQEVGAEDNAGWPSDVREVLGGDIVVALAYRTPAGGTVVLPVTTFGMFDEQASTVTFTSSFGAGRKLSKIAADGRVALAYHAREHGYAKTSGFVLVQGDASFPRRPDPAFLDRLHGERWHRYAPPRRLGRLWNRLTFEYHDLRVPVTVQVRRILAWSEPSATGPPGISLGERLPTDQPVPQQPPAGGIAPRVAASQYRKRLGRSRHTLIGWNGVDGYPVLRPVAVEIESDERLRVESSDPLPKSRRAGLLAHWFGHRMLGQGSAVLTGWLDNGGRYAPHSLAGYEMPIASQLAYELVSSLTAKVGYRKAVKDGLVRDGTWLH